MSTQIKTILILLATLVVGVVAGAAITGALLRERLEYVRSFTKADGFVVRFTEMIEPLSDPQIEQVTPLLETAGAEIEAVFGHAGSDVYAIVERLESDLSAHLTDEQMVRLQMRRAEIRNRYLGRYTVATEEDLSDEK